MYREYAYTRRTGSYRSHLPLEPFGNGAEETSCRAKRIASAEKKRLRGSPRADDMNPLRVIGSVTQLGNYEFLAADVIDSQWLCRLSITSCCDVATETVVAQPHRLHHETSLFFFPVDCFRHIHTPHSALSIATAYMLTPHLPLRGDGSLQCHSLVLSSAQFPHI